MSNSIILSGHFENMQTKSLRRHFSACQITPRKGIKPLFSTKCLYLLSFLIFSLTIPSFYIMSLFFYFFFMDFIVLFRLVLVNLTSQNAPEWRARKIAKLTLY